MEYNKPSLIHYRLAQIISWFVATLIFKRKIIRNEIKGKTGPFVVIANHEAAYDFANLIGASKRPMSFVISNAFFNTLPVKNILLKMGVIPKQQFQTAIKDLKRIKAVIDHGEPLVIYPAGLMCEDGLSTPIPSATYKFLKWLNVDVYIAKTTGTYFVMPKWSKGFRPGRTYLDIYKLFSKEDLRDMDMEAFERKTNEALLFDAYRDQEEGRVTYKGNDSIDGLENVLYMCPHCMTEFSMRTRDKHTIYCTNCGYEQTSDKYAFLHNHKGHGIELRYVSDWSKLIYEHLKQKIKQNHETMLSSKTKIHMIDYKKQKFVEVGQGILSLTKECFVIDGQIKEVAIKLSIPIANFPSLPFSPGKYLEIQQGSDIYRCVLEDGKLAMKFVNMVKIFYELKNLA